MKTTIFEFGGEGGSISIERLRYSNADLYVYHHNEHHFLNEEDDDIKSIERKDVFRDFKTPLEMMNKYPWHLLYIVKVHPDYCGIILKQLLQKLNKHKVTVQDLQRSKNNLEEVFGISLNATLNKKTGITKWTSVKKY